MPTTSNFGFDYESPTSLPGVTLTGGPTSTLPILAVQVDAALGDLQGTVASQASDIEDVSDRVSVVETLSTAVRVKAQLIGTVSTSSGANTLASFTNTLWDTHSMFDGSSTFTCPTGMGGLYQVFCNLVFASNSTGSRAINILHNGTRVATIYGNTHSAAAWRGFCATEVLLSPSDTVQVQGFQTSGGNLNMTGNAAGDLTTFSMSRAQLT
jgi:hypothetical protein